MKLFGNDKVPIMISNKVASILVVYMTPSLFMQVPKRTSGTNNTFLMTMFTSNTLTNM